MPPHLRDEFFHDPGEDQYWSESHYLDFLGEALQGHARIGFYPNRDEANLFAYLVHDETVYWVREESIPPASTHGLVAEGDDWRFGLLPVGDGRAWRVELSGTLARSDDTADVAADEGAPADVSASFTARYRHDPFHYSDGADFPSESGADRYEVATRVEGTATLDGERVDFEGPGERDHSWGRRRWTDAEWLWISGAFEDGSAYNHLSFWLPGGDPLGVNGFWFDGETRQPLTDATLSAEPAFGPDTARGWMRGDGPPHIDLELTWADGAATVAVDPFATTPVDWTDPDSGSRAVLNRSPAHQARDGNVAGRGFLENMTQLPLE